MESIWMGIASGTASTRVVAMSGPGETFLKAQLDAEPKHPRALGTLLEGIALWQGLPVRAALSVGARDTSCGSNLYREMFLDEGGALYRLVWVPTGVPRRRGPRIEGLGSFRDLERLVVEEVAR
jgi:hypothetical protein